MLEKLINMIQNFHSTSFFSGLGLGGVLVFAIRKYIDKSLDRKFDREDKEYGKLHDRYEKLYSPLVHKIMGITIESGGKLTLKRKLSMIVKGILGGNFRYSWNVFKLEYKDLSNEHYLTSFSDFNLEGIRKHIKKYHSLADNKLIELLDYAVRAKQEQDYNDARERSINPNYFNDNHISHEIYNLIDHISKYSKHLNNRLYPK